MSWVIASCEEIVLDFPRMDPPLPAVQKVKRANDRGAIQNLNSVNERREHWASEAFSSCPNVKKKKSLKKRYGHTSRLNTPMVGGRGEGLGLSYVFDHKSKSMSYVGTPMEGARTHKRVTKKKYLPPVRIRVRRSPEESEMAVEPVARQRSLGSLSMATTLQSQRSAPLGALDSMLGDVTGKGSLFETISAVKTEENLSRSPKKVKRKPVPCGFRIWGGARVLAHILARASGYVPANDVNESLEESFTGLQIDRPRTRWRSRFPQMDYQELMMTVKPLLKGRVLELGSGTGIPGLVAAMCGATHVTMTDCDNRVMKLLRANADLNLESLGRGDDVVTVTKLDWESKSDLDIVMNENPGGFDLLLAADVLYEHRIVEVFFDAVRRILASYSRERHDTIDSPLPVLLLANEQRISQVEDSLEKSLLRCVEGRGRECKIDCEGSSLMLEVAGVMRVDGRSPEATTPRPVQLFVIRPVVWFKQPM